MEYITNGEYIIPINSINYIRTVPNKIDNKYLIYIYFNRPINGITYITFVYTNLDDYELALKTIKDNIINN